jgi:predicted nucleic acid-binding protein
MYLLDVNALVALGVLHHEFHERVADWLKSERFPSLATCSITELGFVRVLAQASAYGFTIIQARTLLLQLRTTAILPLVFLPDAQDISHLPAWVKSPRQVTDGHLAQLAIANESVLATLDEKIPGVSLIP